MMPREHLARLINIGSVPGEYFDPGLLVKSNRHADRRLYQLRCGSSLYTELEIMPDVTCVKSGSLDGGAANHDVKVEFYNRDRLGYTKAIDGADQKPEFG